MTMTDERCPKCKGRIIILGDEKICLECSHRLGDAPEQPVTGPWTLDGLNLCPYVHWTIYCNVQGAGCRNCPVMKEYQ